MTTNQSIPYLGASESELAGASAPRRFVGFADQRKLFPHSGFLLLTPDAMVLQGWRDIPRGAIDNVALIFTQSYTRFTAGGIRGQSPSLGFLGSFGKPLVVDLRGEERIYLLIRFRWWTGINQSRLWAPRLEQWLNEPSRPRRDTP